MTKIINFLEKVDQMDKEVPCFGIVVGAILALVTVSTFVFSWFKVLEHFLVNN